MDPDQLKKEAENLNLGATGEPPISTIPGDEGGLKAAVSIKDGMIVLNFGKAITYVAMTPEQAVLLARSLVQFAMKLRP